MKPKPGLLVTVLVLLAGCSGAVVGPVPPPCSSVAKATLAPACTPPRPELSPSGNWAGTLTITEGGSGVQPLTAQIGGAPENGFTGVFTVSDTSFAVTGRYSYTGDAGEELYVFESPEAELVPALTPALFTGLVWSGSLTETTYSGTWAQQNNSNVTAGGTFVLERLP